MEMVAAIVHQLTRDLTEKEIEEQGFAEYYTDHGFGIWPQSAGGIPNSALTYASKGNAVCDLNEDLAAEQKARQTYDNMLRLIDNPDVIAPLRFLREREVVHYQRFGETNLTVSNRCETTYLDQIQFFNDVMLPYCEAL